jgi:hypothetical protein
MRWIYIRPRWQSAIDVEHSRESVENGGIPTSNIASGQSVNLSHPLFLNSCYQIRAVGEDISNHLPCTISWRKLSSAPGRNPSYILFHDAKQTSTKDPRNSLIQACGLKRKSENSRYSPLRATQVFECLWTIYGLKQTMWTTLLLYDSW